MSAIIIDRGICDLCGQCSRSCPFGAVAEVDGRMEIGPGCKACKLCVKACPKKAITLSAGAIASDLSAWNGILIFAETMDEGFHPVTFELLGKAEELASGTGAPVYALAMGRDAGSRARELLHYGPRKVLAYSHPALEHFRADAYANVFEDCIHRLKPSVVLVGATPLGRSLAPRMAARFRTGLTADCTGLKIAANGNLSQVRPAFGGNIMAEIFTTRTRPQFATVRYKVMNPAPRRPTPSGEVAEIAPGDAMISSAIQILGYRKLARAVSITDAETLVVAGRGLRERKDIAMLEELSALLDGQVAATRSVVETGWLDYTRQIGLSGRTVKPKLIITCGVSGAIQFTAGMNGSGCIIAINSDRNAPIFQIAHYGVAGDLYEIVPRLISRVKEGFTCVLQ